MRKITFEQAKDSCETVSANWWNDEQKDYECTYDLDNEYDAGAIPTEELNEEHAYAHLRILEDYFNQKQSNYNEKVKDILWEYVSKNDEEEIFKRIAEVEND